MLTLHTAKGHYKAMRVLIAAQYNDIAVKVNYVTKADVDSKDWKAKSPLGRVPVLELANGECVFEATAAARYVARMNMSTDLLGKSFLEQSQVDAWVDFSLQEIELAANILCYPVIGHAAGNSLVAATEHAQKDLLAALNVLEAHLATRTFLVGNSVTLADICVASALVYPMKFILDKSLRKGLSNVERWYTTCVNQDEFKCVVGPAQPCSASLAPKKKEGGKKGKKKNKGKQQKKQQPKAAAAPKEEEIKDPILSLKKFKDYVKTLPKCSLNFEEWKRTYQNEPKEKAMAYFYDKVGKQETCSVWYFDYKYNSDLKVAWMVGNQLTGFIQRCDAVRSHSFGTLYCFGDPEEKNLQVAGCIVIIGTDMQNHMVREELNWGNPDACWYEYKQLDLSSAEDKAKIESMFYDHRDQSDDAKLVWNGKTIYDGKLFL